MISNNLHNIIMQDLSDVDKKNLYHLQNKIVLAIQQNHKKFKHNCIAFSDYMNIVLYAEEFSYYTNLSKIQFGLSGDFITAPLVSNLFAKTIFKQLLELYKHGMCHNICELGAGNGKLMLDLLLESKLHNIALKYFIIEKSQTQIARQKALLQEHNVELSLVTWLDDIPYGFNGVILANELLDALPTELLKIHANKLYRRCVSYSKNSIEDTNQYSFHFTDKLIYDFSINKLYLYDEELTDLELQHVTHNKQDDYYNDEIRSIEDIVKQVKLLDLNYTECDNYIFDLNLEINKLITKLSNNLNEAVIFFFDYGDVNSVLYKRNLYESNPIASIRGFYKHNVINDVLLYQGLIDITVNVNFSFLAQIAINNNLDLIGYTSNANFLINLGIEKALQEKIQTRSSNESHSSLITELKLTQEVNELIAKDRMGDIYLR